MDLVAFDFAGAGISCWVLATACLLLRYDRGAIAAGGWWRLLTAHIVHLDAAPPRSERAGPGADVVAVRDDYDAVEWCVIVLAGALAISSGLWWLSPRVAGTWGVGRAAFGDGGRGGKSTSSSAPGIDGSLIVFLAHQIGL
jgi:hypothetical protein